MIQQSDIYILWKSIKLYYTAPSKFLKNVNDSFNNNSLKLGNNQITFQ